jgi:hypothetical protein
MWECKKFSKFFDFVFFRIFYWVSRRLQLSRVSSTTFLTWGRLIKSKLWIFISILSINCLFQMHLLFIEEYKRINTVDQLNGSLINDRIKAFEWMPMMNRSNTKRNKKKIIWIWLSSIGRSRKRILRCCEKLPNFKLLNGKS